MTAVLGKVTQLSLELFWMYLDNKPFLSPLTIP